MKLYKYLFIIIFVATLTGCEDYFGENSNVDPDEPIVATVNVLLPQVQARIAYTWGGDFSRYLGINTQHVDGVGRQFVVIGNYGIVPGDVNTAWSNIYSGTINSNRTMSSLAQEGGFAHYEALGLLLESYAIMMATDVWGDIPYSDAFAFAENGGVYSPTFDSQEVIYDAIFANITRAKELLAGESGAVAPGDDDLFYQGDISKWSKMANVLMARARLHLSKVNGDAYSQVLTALNEGGFEGSDDDFDFQFGTSTNENAPWFQYIEQRDDCEVGSNYVSLLEAQNDPRVATYGFEHSGDNPVFVNNQNVELISYTEQEFMRAEALMATGDKAGSFDAMMNGLMSSLNESGASFDSSFIDGLGVTADNITMNDIMTQKYLALYTSAEVFNDWRRTGIPSLNPVTGAEIPRRLPYPESENLANPNTPSPAEVTIFSRVWWDQ